MALNSIVFIFTFLPILLLLHRLIPSHFRTSLLIGASLLFYAWGEPIYIFLILLSMAYTYLICTWLDDPDLTQRQRKNLCIQAIAVHVFLLVYLKYYGFILDSFKEIFQLHISYRVLPQPLGISFYCFMVISYIADVYTHKIEAEKDKKVFCLYVLFFPKMIMGPIERFADMKKQILHPDVSIASFSCGVERFISGLAKKVILADSFGLLWTEISAIEITELSVLTAWIGALAYTLQIYFDFSGYSDMAIGIGKMLGITLSENFHYPYIARSIRDFWRRWHISLSSWFRDYVYIPLGGSHTGIKKHIRNILIVWGLTGIWHGANWNFIAWGLYFGILLLAEKYIFYRYMKKCHPLWRQCLTFLAVMFGWVLFACDSLSQALSYIQIMLGFGSRAFSDVYSAWLIQTNILFFIIGLVCMTPIVKQVIEKFRDHIRYGEYAVGALYLLLFLVSIACIISSTYQSFLYTQF